MNKKQETSNSQKMNVVRKPNKSLKERCKELGAIPLSQFEKEFWEAFNRGYKKHGRIM